MKRQALNAEIREDRGKGAARSLRRAGSLPAVIYKEGKSVALKLNARETLGFLRATKGEQVLVELMLGDGSKKLALLKDFQRNPVRGELLHMDFVEVALDKKIILPVNLATVGIAAGVKLDGGIMQQQLRQIIVECLPDDIPGHLEVDVTPLHVGQSLHVKDIALPENVKVLTDGEETIVTISSPSAGGAEEAVAAAVAEPEVKTKGKAVKA